MKFNGELDINDAADVRELARRVLLLAALLKSYALGKIERSPFDPETRISPEMQRLLSYAIERLDEEEAARIVAEAGRVRHADAHLGSGATNGTPTQDRTGAAPQSRQEAIVIGQPIPADFNCSLTPLEHRDGNVYLWRILRDNLILRDRLLTTLQGCRDWVDASAVEQRWTA